MWINKIIKFGSLSLVLLLLAFTTTYSQKYGHLDANALLYELPATQKALKELETYKEQLGKKIADRQEKLQKRYNDIQQNISTYTPIQLQEFEKEIQDEAQSIDALSKKSNQDILVKEQELTDPIYQKIRTAIDEVALENGYTYIFDAGILLYADEKLGNDIAPLVKKKLEM